MTWMMEKGKHLDGFVGAPVKLDGFTVATGSDSTSMGIIFWKKVFVVRNSNVPGGKMGILLMETQGLWDPDTPNDMNCCIFGISCMLSSYLMINQKGVITSELLTLLATLTKFSLSLNDRSSKIFQHMDLIIRDHPDIDPNSENLQDYISVSQQQKQKTERSPAFSESIAQLKSCFQEYNVVCFPCPGNIDSKGYNGDISSICPLFLRCVGHYIESVIRDLRPRMVGEVPLTGRTFREYDYVDMLMC